jgi:hypothetical protein
MKEALQSEVENRLDHLFEEKDGPPEEKAEPPEAEASSGEFSLSPLKGLKAVLLSIDWEITDEIMASLLAELKRLEEVFRDDKIPLTFLQILTAIGKYIRHNKGNAHPTALKLMDSVYKAMEKVVMSEGMSREEKESLLLSEMTMFKHLKEDIALRRSKRKDEGPVVSVSVPALDQAIPAEEGAKLRVRPELSQMPAHDAFATAVEEIKDLLRAEFKALRAEIRLWRGSE